MSLNSPSTKQKAKSQQPAAVRMRTYRRRRKRNYQLIRIEVAPSEIRGLIAKGYLEEKHVDDRREVKAALNAWVSDALMMA
jgi:hypothetical protein